MKVLFVTHNAALYGANRSLINLIEGLNMYDVKPMVLCPEQGELTNFLRAKRISYIVKRFDNWIYIRQLGFLKLPVKIIRTILFRRAVLPLIQKFDPDIIYSNSSVTFMGAILSCSLKKPHIWHVREFGKSDYNVKFHFGKIGFRYLLNKASAIVSISKAIDKIVLKAIKAPKHIVYNGVIWESGLTKIGKTQDRKMETVFGLVGLLVPGKNQLEAIKAFSILNDKWPETKLLIIGDGNDEKYKDHLMKEVNSRCLNKSVSFLGFISDLAKIYSQIDVLLMCSRNEGMGRVTVEAMSKGIPVIGYRGGATPEIIKHRFNGLLYEKGEEELASMMMQLASNRALYSEFSMRGIETVKKSFTIEKYSSEIYSILKGEIAKKAL